LLADRGAITQRVADAMRAATGLRNRIAHGYVRVEHRRIYDEVLRVCRTSSPIAKDRMHAFGLTGARLRFPLDSPARREPLDVAGAENLRAQRRARGRQCWADVIEPKNHGASRNRRSWRRSGGSKTRV